MLDPLLHPFLLLLVVGLRRGFGNDARSLHLLGTSLGIYVDPDCTCGYFRLDHHMPGPSLLLLWWTLLVFRPGHIVCGWFLRRAL